MRRFRRPGLSLLEVIFAMAIFLTSLAALAQLISMANTAAYEAKYRSLAVQLARSKMAEVRVGAVALDSVGDSPLPDDSDFNWEMDVSSGSVEGLHQVTLRVYRMRPNGSRIEASLSELIIEPTLVGSTLDVAPVISESTPDSSGSALGSGSSSTGSSSGTGMGGTGSSGKTGGTGS
ncbi:MAG: hypothetical protein EBV06_17945, partial [Planctomycetia bacterium]|nr:hypothetical protein [Planctomycetia bacterium]